MSMKNVLVTGGAGFIGSNLALELQRRGVQVTILDDYSSSSFRNLIGFKGEVVIGDESRLEGMKDSFDAIFHLAANADTTFKDDKEMIRKNTDGFRKVLDYALKNGCRVVYASSAATYGDGKSPMREGQEPKPLNAYAFSKFIMDNMARKEAKKGISIVGVRYFNVYGFGEFHKGKSASMIFQLQKQIAAGKNPRIFKYGEQVRDHIYVKDAVAATIKAAEFEGVDVFNVGSGFGITFNEVIDYLNAAMGTKFKPEYFDNPYVGLYQDKTVADMSKIKKALGFTPKFHPKKGIADYVATLKAHGQK